jgi:hypothetical protein
MSKNCASLAQNFFTTKSAKFTKAQEVKLYLRALRGAEVMRLQQANLFRLAKIQIFPSQANMRRICLRPGKE